MCGSLFAPRDSASLSCLVPSHQLYPQLPHLSICCKFHPKIIIKSLQKGIMNNLFPVRAPMNLPEKATHGNLYGLPIHLPIYNPTDLQCTGAGLPCVQAILGPCRYTSNCSPFSILHLHSSPLSKKCFEETSMRFMTLKQIELTRNKIFLVIFSLLHLHYINFILQVYH